MIKTYIVSQIKKEYYGEVDRIGIRIEITDPELISQILKKNNLILYTKAEMNVLRKERDFLTKVNHKLGNDIQKMESWLKINHPKVFREMKKGLK